MSIKIVSFGPVHIAAEAFGDPTDPPVLLIMGAMASMLWWPDEFCQDLAARGRYVIRYDNRDTGLSSRSEPGNPDYTYEDLAADAVRVLDAYGIGKAHLVGMSLGGMIGQIAVLSNPDRFLSFTAISTSPMGIDKSGLPGMSAAYLDHAATAETVDWSDNDQTIAFLRREMKVIGSTRHPHDADAARSFLERDAARSRGYDSATNHFMLQGGETVPGGLEAMKPPLLVIHGSADPVFPPAHGEALAKVVPGARFVTVPGGGHEIHPGDVPLFLDEIERHTLQHIDRLPDFLACPFNEGDLTMTTLVSRRALLASAAAFPTLAAFPSLARASGGKLSTAALADLQAAMDAHVASGYLPGAIWVVEHDGELHVGTTGSFELGGGRPMARDTIFRVASITKPLTAAIAMMLVEEGKLTLDDPVDDLLPELANRRVLRTLESPLDDTVPAERPITLRHLLTMTFGLGAVMVFPEAHPIQAAMREAGIAPGFVLPPLSSDAYMAALGSLPLAAQPGDRFFYNNGLDVAGILIERAEKKRLGAVMAERLFVPLGMKDTGFSVAADKLDRLPTQYGPDFASPGAIKPFTPPEWTDFSQAPPLESGAGGLVTTVDDYLQFCRMMLNGGELDGRRYLKPESVAEMVRDQLTDAHKADPMASFFLSEGGGSWGLGMAVMTKKAHPWMMPGRFGWDGGFGTSAYTDPATRTIGILFTQRMMDSPSAPVTFTDFWSHAYRATES